MAVLDHFRDSQRAVTRARHDADPIPTKAINLLADLKILTLPRLPARLTADEACFLLRIDRHELSWATAAGLLRPLGNPEPNAPKFFASIQILELAEDPAKLHQLTCAISDGWRRKNASRKSTAAREKFASVDGQ